jgi:hypothetical protein
MIAFDGQFKLGTAETIYACEFDSQSSVPLSFPYNLRCPLLQELRPIGRLKIHPLLDLVKPNDKAGQYPPSLRLFKP